MLTKSLINLQSYKLWFLTRKNLIKTWVRDNLQKYNASQSNAMGKHVYTLPVAVKTGCVFQHNTLHKGQFSKLASYFKVNKVY